MIKLNDNVIKGISTEMDNKLLKNKNYWGYYDTYRYTDNFKFTSELNIIMAYRFPCYLVKFADNRYLAHISHNNRVLINCPLMKFP